MKVLLFTHEQDIDGMGNAILGKLAFENFDFITCKTFEINQRVQETIDNGSIYSYDKIFVTDLCIKEPLLGWIDKDERIKEKILILDHHKSEMLEGNDKYSFVNIVLENEKGKVSGTSLFYDYLLMNNYLESNVALDELVEWTRQYDTWEWKKYNNENGRKLHVLFEVLGYQKYIDMVLKMLLRKDGLVFDDEQLEIINKFNEDFKRDVKEILAGMKVYELEIDDKIYRVGYVNCIYKYRNDINEVIMKDNVNDIDTVGMIMTDMDVVSYRNVKPVDASLIAVYFGGKGHKGAATNPKNNEKFQEVLAMFE